MNYLRQIEGATLFLTMSIDEISCEISTATNVKAAWFETKL